MKKYQIIYADPPWSYNDKQKSGGTAYFGASVRYNTMSNKDICTLPIKNLLDKNCVLFLWATNPLLPEALEVINSWGFKYKTVAFCWIKKNKCGSIVSNMGRWTMGGMELCLLATRGHIKRQRRDIKQIVSDIRIRHSAKPPVIRELIVSLMGDLPRIELFGRRNSQMKLDGTNTFDGWDVWGNEIESSINLLKVDSMESNK